MSVYGRRHALTCALGFLSGGVGPLRLEGVSGLEQGDHMTRYW